VWHVSARQAVLMGWPCLFLSNFVDLCKIVLRSLLHSCFGAILVGALGNTACGKQLIICDFLRMQYVSLDEEDKEVVYVYYPVLQSINTIEPLLHHAHAWQERESKEQTYGHE